MALHFTVFVGVSVDGFLAREDGALDWLPQEGVEDHGYEALMAETDTLLVGRGTYETARGFDPWPYAGKRVVVLSHREVPRRADAPVERWEGEPREVAARLEATGARRVYVDGGRTVQSFLRAGLVDRLVVTRVPVLIGRGIPLFGPLDGDVRLEHVRTVAYPSGLVTSEYRPRRSA